MVQRTKTSYDSTDLFSLKWEKLLAGETLSDIKIQVEQSDYESGNFHSVLMEIKFALEQLLQHNKTHCIDLRAMPWSPEEEQKLENKLGRGELSVELNALGKSTFYETRYSGVWIVSHYNQEGEIIAKLIEISTLPEMIFSQQEDIRNSLERLTNSLERLNLQS